MELDPDFSAEMKDTFSLFDFDSTGQISTGELGTVLRGLGYNLTEKEIGHFINENDHNSSGKLDFPTFYNIVANNQPMRQAFAEEEVLELFDVFDIYNDGYIQAADLVYLLRELGEPLTMDDVTNLLREITIDGDKRVNIADLVEHMYSTSAP
eukprot:CAMPEP_0175095642 /NCGR_PEP_ID=MMETSP0086_2-20121207/4276_1 /TAXON_ID=136419 /ORGANISM="Unknown Unknown, Strain D1" /LENGTH=152 /DNA_ID=CAMNT_0016368927 /DNA_START=37 /DNA_END=495 /DNA_ORIENTATION=+